MGFPQTPSTGYSCTHWTTVIHISGITLTGHKAWQPVWSLVWELSCSIRYSQASLKIKYWGWKHLLSEAVQNEQALFLSLVLAERGWWGSTVLQVWLFSLIIHWKGPSLLLLVYTNGSNKHYLAGTSIAKRDRWHSVRFISWCVGFR